MSVEIKLTKKCSIGNEGDVLELKEAEAEMVVNEGYGIYESLNPESIKTFYKLLGHRKQTEIRAFELSADLKKSTCRGHFFVSSEEDFLKKIKEFNGKYNLYAGLNERTDRGTEAKNVISVKRIFIDIDCINKPATEEDLEEAEKVTDKLISEYEMRTGLRPSKIYSGNGFQLIYCIPEIQITEENREKIQSQIQEFMRHLIKKYSTNKVKLDNVGDLPRIIRITGTTNIKGGRISEFIEIHEEENLKLKEYILSFKIEEDLSPDVNTGKDNSRSGLEFRKVLSLLRDGKNREEIYKIMSAYSKWKESTEQYRSLTFEKAEDVYLKEKEQQDKKENLTEEDLELLKNPNIFNEITEKEFDKKIVGEIETRKVIFLCACGRLVENHQTASYNLLVNDEAGAGKDHVTKAVLEILPKEQYIHKTRISPTVFTYWHNPQYEPEWTWNGKVFYPEDISEPVLNSDVFKVMSSNGSSATVVIKQRAYEIDIKGKPVLITTTATATPNPELTRRFAMLNLDSSENQTKAIMKRHSKFRALGIIPEYDEKYTKALLGLKRVKVRIPFAELIDEHFPSKSIMMRTNYPRFLDYISAVCAFHQFQRQQDEQGYFLASDQDYDIARECFLKVCSNKYMINLTINQKKILGCFEKEPHLIGTATELHGMMNFMSDRALMHNLRLLTQYGILSISIEKDSQNRDRETFSLSKSYNPNEKINIPTSVEICRNTSLSSLSSLSSIPSPSSLCAIKQVDREDTETTEGLKGLNQLDIKQLKVEIQENFY